MSRELDRRNLSDDRITSTVVRELHSLAARISEKLPGDHTISVSQVDRTMGVPRVVISESAPAAADAYIERALDHVHAISPVLGLLDTAPEYVPAPEIQKTESGAVTVHLQQHHDGIPVFQATETVRFNPDGSVRDTAGSSADVTGVPAPDPDVALERAVQLAAEHVTRAEDDEHGATDQFGVTTQPLEVDLSDFDPRVETSLDDSPRRTASLTGGPFEDISAGLLWFPLSESDMRLTWEVLLTFPGYASCFRVLVDATDGEILYCRDLVQSMASGNVYRVDGSKPRELTDFPLDLDVYRQLANSTQRAADFPQPWVTDSSTAGNCTFAHLATNPDATPGQERDGDLVFDPGDETGDDQKVLNIFYFNCFMHDLCYLLGFRESDGNFQASNLNLGGVEGDRVDARAHSGAVQGTANMLTLQDGTPPVMNMGLVPDTGRHTAFDSSVVFHEFMHGVTNRMVGGPNDDRSLESPQSRGMGEGWSDWIACTVNGTEVVGAWVVDNPTGIREHRYDESFPDGFGDLGTGRYQAGSEHAIGEIWCATLMSLNRKLGVPLTLQLVFDALTLSAANPSFLDMRDDILQAAELMDAAGQLERPLADVKRDIWSVFARYGMGPGARSQGAQVAGIVADNSVPA